MTHHTHKAGIRRDEIVVVTRPGSDSHWAARDLVGRARRRFGRKVLQIVVEPNAVELSGTSQARSLRPLAAPSIAKVYPIRSLVCGHAKANG